MRWAFRQTNRELIHKIQINKIADEEKELLQRIAQKFNGPVGFILKTYRLTGWFTWRKQREKCLDTYDLPRLTIKSQNMDKPYN